MKYLLNTATIEVFPEKCTGCGMCMDVCPHEVFTLNNKKAIIQDRDSCMECGACVSNCAFNAVAVNKGVGCAFALINSMMNGGEPSCDCSGSDKKSNCC